MKIVAICNHLCELTPLLKNGKTRISSEATVHAWQSSEHVCCSSACGKIVQVISIIQLTGICLKGKYRFICGACM
jgi:hypothetical protein